jgi:hypothetical protein
MKVRIVLGACLVLILAAWSGAALVWAEPQDKKQAAAAKPDEDNDLTGDEKKEAELKGCGPKEEKHSAETDKKTHPEPTPPADKALLFVVRPTMMGNKIQTKLAVDGTWVGVNRGNNYFFVVVEPGLRYLCSSAENRSVMKLTVEAGKTYYLQQKIRMGMMKASNKLELIDEAEGKKALGKTHPSVFAVKK